MPASDQSIAPLRRDPGCRLTAWKPWSIADSSLLGYCSIAFPGGWVVHHVPIFRTKDDGLAAGVPSIPLLDRDGHVKLKPDGKRAYSVALSFEARERWSRMVLGALVQGGIWGAP